MNPITHPTPESLRTAVEPRRLQILEYVWDHERSVTEIASRLPVSMAAVSQHLAKLRDAGLVSVRAEGRKRFYRATKADMGELAVILESFWGDQLRALKHLAESVERDAAPPASRRRKPRSHEGGPR